MRDAKGYEHCTEYEELIIIINDLKYKLRVHQEHLIELDKKVDRLNEKTTKKT